MDSDIVVVAVVTVVVVNGGEVNMLILLNGSIFILCVRDFIAFIGVFGWFCVELCIVVLFG